MKRTQGRDSNSYPSKSLKEKKTHSKMAKNMIRHSLTLGNHSNADTIKYSNYKNKRNFDKTNQISNLFIKARDNVADQKKSNSDVLFDKKLKDICWTGIPKRWRSTIWKHFFRASHVKDQQDLYSALLNKLNSQKEEIESQIYPSYFKQCRLDAPRTLMLIQATYLNEVFGKETMVQILLNILRVFVLHNPHIGYTQGMNEVAAFILTTYLAESEQGINCSGSKEEYIRKIETETFVSFTNLVEGLDPLFHESKADEAEFHIKFSDKLKKIVKIIDEEFYGMIEGKQVDFLNFACRWIGCLYLREAPRKCVERFWDTFLCESEGGNFYKGFVEFGLYLSASIILGYKEVIKDMDFQDIVLFFQKLPTDTWSEEDVDTLLSKAYIYKTIYEDSSRLK